MTRFPSRALAALLFSASTVTLAADWPQWMGPERNGTSPETGLLTTFPPAGPKVLWKVEGGDGYSAVAVVGKRAVTMVQRGKDELVLALDAGTGQELWKVRCGPAYTNDFGNGPRATPAIDGKRVYVQAASGPFLCLDLEKGDILWQHHLLKEFNADNISWGLSASPLVVGDLVLAIPGGKGAAVVAFDKSNGKVLWKTGDDKAAYASPVVTTMNGMRQAIFFTANGLLAVQMNDGKELWRVPWLTEYDVNIATPLLIGDQLFVSSGEKVGCALFHLMGNEKPGLVWESRGPKSVMINYWANAVAFGKHLYGISGEYNRSGDLNCVDLAAGKLAWSSSRFGLSSLTLADGHLFIVVKNGDLVVVPATPKGFEEKARVKVLEDGRYATVPTIAGKRLFLRDRKNIVCLDIAGR
jgi:outer membrane protein assembly factor BamB